MCHSHDLSLVSPTPAPSQSLRTRTKGHTGPSRWAEDRAGVRWWGPCRLGRAGGWLGGGRAGRGAPGRDPAAWGVVVEPWHTGQARQAPAVLPGWTRPAREARPRGSQPRAVHPRSRNHRTFGFLPRLHGCDLTTLFHDTRWFLSSSHMSVFISSRLVRKFLVVVQRPHVGAWPLRGRPSQMVEVTLRGPVPLGPHHLGTMGTSGWFLCL